MTSLDGLGLREGLALRFPEILVRTLIEGKVLSFALSHRRTAVVNRCVPTDSLEKMLQLPQKQRQ